MEDLTLSAEVRARIATDGKGTDGNIEKITDYAEIAKAGVLSTPAVVIDGHVKCVGKVPSKDEVLEWLQRQFWL